MARGSIFHKAVEDWAATGKLVEPDDAEIWGWLLLLQSQWKPLRGMRFEVALGLNVDGGFTPVQELKPHVYTPAQDSVPSEYLLTAGRADVIWASRVGTGLCVHVLDWKTGAYPPENPATNLQFWALGMAAARMAMAESVQVGAYHARDGVFEWSDVVTVDGASWDERWEDVKAAATVGEEPKPGENCIKCWEKRECKFYEQA